MNDEQMGWAAKHDWFLGAFEFDGVWDVLVGGIDGMETFFTDFQELRAWAGY